SGAPQRVARDEGGGRVRAAPGQSTGDGDLLAQVQPAQRLPAGGRGEHPDGAQHQVRVVERQDAGPFALHRQRERVTVPGGQLVVAPDRVVDRGQLVVPVGARRTDLQVQVHL